MKIGFDTRNFVARASRYDGIPDLAHHEAETRRRFNIPSMANWLDLVADIGFDGLSVWTGHCWYPEASRQQVEAIRDLGRKVGLVVYALNGRLGEPDPGARESWEHTVEAVDRLGASFLSGQPRGLGRDYLPTLARGRKIMAFRNGPGEERPLDIMARIDRCEDWMGVSLDLGWCLRHGMDISETIRILRRNLVEVYLTDVRKGRPESSCALGDGELDLRAVCRSLRVIEFEGWLTVGHTPYDRDPLPEVDTSVQRLRDALGI